MSPSSTLQLVSTVFLAAEGLSAVAVIVSPALPDFHYGRQLHTLSQPNYQEKRFLHVASYLQQPQWCQLTNLVIKHDQSAKRGIKHLDALQWPRISVLDLSNNNLDAAAASALAQGSWPALKVLDLGSNQMDVAACSHIADGDWPVLQVLKPACVTAHGCNPVFARVLAGHDCPM